MAIVVLVLVLVLVLVWWGIVGILSGSYICIWICICSIIVNIIVIVVVVVARTPGRRFCFLIITIQIGNYSIQQLRVEYRNLWITDNILTSNKEACSMVSLISRVAAAVLARVNISLPCFASLTVFPRTK